MKGKKGFTLIEIIVVVAIISLLAGVLTPMIFNALGDAKVSTAKADIKSISTGVLLFNRDTGLWPYCATEDFPEQHYEYLTSDEGEIPDLSQVSWNEGESDNFANHLTQNSIEYNNWKGPYLQSVGADPWGRTYLLWARGFVKGSNEYAWVLSAGPNGIVETDITDMQVRGDDIGFYITSGQEEGGGERQM